MGGLFLIPLLLGHPPQDDRPVRLADLWAEARGVTVQAPSTPSIHYRMTGVATFGLGEDAIHQEADLWTGGPARFRYTLRTPKAKNVFLVAGPEDAWVSTPGSQGFKDYPPDELLLEAWLRWTLLRWPWDWVEGFEVLSDQDPVEISLPSPHGPATIRFGPDHLPERAVLGSVTLELGGWTSSKGKPLLPHEWVWTLHGNARAESFAQVAGGVLCLDGHFRPPGTPSRSWTTVSAAPGKTGNSPADWIGVVSREFRHAPLARWPRAESSMGTWVQVPLKGKTLRVGVASEDWKAEWLVNGGERAWLCWSTYIDLSPMRGADLLRKVARDQGWEVRGPVWASVPEGDERLRRREFLLEVAANGKEYEG